MYHQNQLELANSVVNSIKLGYRAHTVIAQTQSGKTGCIAAIIYHLKQLREFSDYRFIVVCSMPYKDLKAQTAQEMIKNYGVLNDVNDILFQHDLAKHLKLNRIDDDQMNIARDRHLDSFFGQKIVVLHDEAHWGSDRDSTVHRFLDGLGITPDGCLYKWKNPHNCLITISATPMAEIADYHNHGTGKKTHIMKPGTGYYGFGDMESLGRLKMSTKLNFNTQDGLRTLLSAIDSHKNMAKYMIIRINSSNKNGVKNIETLSDILRSMDVCMLDATSDRDSDVDNVAKCVKTEPTKATVIVIYHRLRAGIQLDTQHVSMVYDHSDGCDVTAQGLAGRCTGYGKKNHGVTVYCNVTRLRDYLDWFRDDYGYERIPHHSKNIKNGSGSHVNQVSHQKHVPLGTVLSDDLIRHFKDQPPRLMSRLYQQYRDDIWNEISGKIDHEAVKFQPPLNRDGHVKSDITIVNDSSSRTTKNTWWYQINRHLKDMTECGFGETQGLLKDESYRALFINAMNDDIDCGRAILVYMTPRESVNILSTGQEQYHPDNNKFEKMKLTLGHDGHISKEKHLERVEDLHTKRDDIASSEANGSIRIIGKIRVMLPKI